MASLNGTPDADTLTGGSGDDTLNGLGGNDILRGGAGKDTLDGGAGNDYMVGGLGNDVYFVDAAGDVVEEASNGGTDRVIFSGNSPSSYTLPANVENLDLAGTALAGVGNALANVLTGNVGNNTLSGGEGNDNIGGGSGDDRLSGDGGNDTLNGGVDTDTLVGGAGNDVYIQNEVDSDVIIEVAGGGVDTVQTTRPTYVLPSEVEVLEFTGISGTFNGTGNAIANALTGGASNDTLSGLAGNDSLVGGAGNDALNGGDGADNLVGGTGDDTLDGGTGLDAMLGGAGDDVYFVDETGDVITETTGAGTDTVQSTALAYTLSAHVDNLTLTGTSNASGTGNDLPNLLNGNSGANSLSGGANNDTLNGAPGNDTLDGGAGNDILDGGLGADLLVGGAGDDTYWVDDAGDNVLEAAPGGTDTVFSSVSRTLMPLWDNVENLVLVGSGNLDALGNAGPNTVTGNNLRNILDGGAGDDNLLGMDGDDILSGGLGNDTLDGGVGADLLAGGDGDDTYVAVEAGDTITEGPTGGLDTVQTSQSAYTLPDNVERLVFTGTGPLNARGNFSDNTLTGTSGADTLTGLAGNDTLDGGAGADTMIGGADNDTYVVNTMGDVVFEAASDGADTVRTTIANYPLPNNVENLIYLGSAGTTLTGSNDANALTGGSGADILIGGNGNDTLDGGAGIDILVGGAGNDTYIVDNAAEAVTEAADGNTDTVITSLAAYTLPANVENLVLSGTANINGTGNSLPNALTGNAGNNALSGGTGNDTLFGNAGADTLDGGGGADALFGGPGNDIYIVDDIGDVITEDANAGTDTVNSSISLMLTSPAWDHVENIVLTGTEALSATGNGLDNTLTGNAGNNTLDGGNGNDTLIGGAGDDTYIVNGGDTITEAAGAGTDTVRTALNSYTLPGNVEQLVFTGGAGSGTGNADANNLTGGNGNDTLSGLAGNDLLNGAGGNDILSGGEGDDALDGGGGDDTLVGGAGNDTYFVDSIGDVVTEATGAGTDSVNSNISLELTSPAWNNVENIVLTGTAAINAIGNSANNTLTGNVANNVLSGGEGNDSLDGEDGVDTLAGNAGNDVLLGGESDDRLLGGEGQDTLDGGVGADTLFGGPGNDIYLVDDLGDVITEDADDGTDTVISLVTHSLDDDVENLVLSGTTAINGTGNNANNTLTGNAANNVLNGGDGNDSLDGGDGADTLMGGNGDDILTGGLGQDTMVGGLGDDIYILDNASEVVIEAANEGTDTVRTSVSIAAALWANVDHLVYAGTASFTATGNELGNAITGGAGADNLSGGGGNDTLDGGAGIDTLVGGAGNDIYILDNAADVVIEAADGNIDTVFASSPAYTLPENVEYLVLSGTANINGTGNSLPNTLTGNAGNNALSGGEGNDTLLGNAGADTLDGGAGADTLFGGPGNDIYVVDDIGDVITEVADAGTDTVNSNISLVLTSPAWDNVENIVLTGTEALSATGNLLANTITGNAGNNTLDGGAGNDTLIGGAGNDIYVVDSTGDAVTEAASAGTDTVQVFFSGLFTSYTLPNNVEQLVFTSGAGSGTGNNEANTLTGGNGNDGLSGLTGNDLLVGNGGADTLDGGAGQDTLMGGIGDDTYMVDNPDDVVVEAPGGGTADTVVTSLDYEINDEIENLSLTGSASVGVGNALANVITGNEGANILLGGAGNDTVYGGAGADEVYGQEGDDSLYSSTLANPTDTAVDILVGGPGNDTYYVGSSDDVVIEWSGQGTDTVVVNSPNGYYLGENVENLTLQGNTPFGVGNALDNLITGNNQGNFLIGGRGNDTLAGGGGTDMLVGGDDNDVFRINQNAGLDIVGDFKTGADQLDLSAYGFSSYAGLPATQWRQQGQDALLDLGGGNVALLVGVDLVTLGFDTIPGGANDSIIIGTSVAETIDAGAGNDVIVAGDGNDRLLGGNGDDILSGGLGQDTMLGGLGDDIYIVDDVGDVVTEGASEGTDTVTSSNVSINFTGSAWDNLDNIVLFGTQNLNATGNILANSITGNAGNNTLDGGAGNDTLIGGAGADMLTGGADSDVFILSTAGDSGLTLATADRITGFNTGLDVLRLGLAGNDGVNYSEASTAVTDFEAALEAANGALAALNGGAGSSEAQLYNFQFDAANGYLFIDRDGDGAADEVIVLVGITANAGIAPTNIGGP
jgi:Ca2+-binding RTX toxin-like protein